MRRNNSTVPPGEETRDVQLAKRWTCGAANEAPKTTQMIVLSVVKVGLVVEQPTNGDSQPSMNTRRLYPPVANAWGSLVEL